MSAVAAVIPSRDESIAPRRILVADISVDADYQRDLEQTRVQKMVAEWDGRRCSPLVLSSRGGRLWCVDGQHRLAAMRALGVEFCYAVMLELTKVEEADLFVGTQYGRKSLNAHDLFKAETVALHADVLTIIRIVHRFGYTLSRMTGFNNIGAVGALRRIFKLGGENLLTVTLDLTRAQWASADGASGSSSRQGIVLYGLAIFLHSFRGEPQFDMIRAQRILEKNSPAKFIRAAQEIAMTKRSAGTSPVNVAEAIRNSYNTGLSKHRQMDSIRLTKKAGILRKKSV